MLEDAVIPVVKKKQVNSYETKYYVGGISGDAVMDCMICLLYTSPSPRD